MGDRPGKSKRPRLRQSDGDMGAHDPNLWKHPSRVFFDRAMIPRLKPRPQEPRRDSWVGDVASESGVCLRRLPKNEKRQTTSLDRSRGASGRLSLKINRS